MPWWEGPSGKWWCKVFDLHRNNFHRLVTDIKLVHSLWLQFSITRSMMSFTKLQTRQTVLNQRFIKCIKIHCRYVLPVGKFKVFMSTSMIHISLYIYIYVSMKKCSNISTRNNHGFSLQAMILLIFYNYKYSDNPSEYQDKCWTYTEPLYKLMMLNITFQRSVMQQDATY